jgi:oligopeptide transport system permease protein
MVPTVLAAALLAFALVARAAGGDSDPLLGRAEELPLFYNADPRDVRDRADAAVALLARGPSREGAAELLRLGGAALPHVLPLLPTLPTEARTRIATELMPLARRMGLRAERVPPEELVLFWSDFWEERSVDFRAAVAERAVARVAERSSPSRREELRVLDTFALPALIDALGTVRTAEDVERARRLTRVASDVTGLNLRVHAGQSPDTARSIVRTWQRWWEAHESDYVSFDGLGKTLAALSETRFGHWLEDVSRGELGTTRSGEPVAERITSRAPTSVRVLGFGLFTGLVIGIGLGITGRGRFGWPLGLGAALPPALVGPVIALHADTEAPRRQILLAGLVLALFVALVVAHHLRVRAAQQLESEHALTARAFGVPEWRIALRGLRESVSSVLGLLASELPTLLSAAFILELAFGLEGLARPTFAALVDPDPAWLMALALGTTLAVALTRTVLDALLLALDPRLRSRLRARWGALE